VKRAPKVKRCGPSEYNENKNVVQIQYKYI